MQEVIIFDRDTNELMMLQTECIDVTQHNDASSATPIWSVSCDKCHSCKVFKLSEDNESTPSSYTTDFDAIVKNAAKRFLKG